MDVEVLATEVLARELRDREAHVSALRAEQAGLLAELDRRQAATAAGCRSLEEWVAGRLDVEHRSAARLVSLARMGRPELLGDLADGEITVDRALAEARLAACGVSDDVIGDTRRRASIRGVHRLAARRRRHTPVDEQAAFAGRFLSIQPNLDASRWDLRGQLAGVDGQAVAELVDRRADALPASPDGRAALGPRRADALVELVLDGAAADGSDHRGGGIGVVATVFVDAALAAASHGATGAEIVGGPRIGPHTLAELLCTGTIELDIDAATPLAAGPATHSIPPRLRRYVIARDGGACTADGCRSRYRLQAHHIVPRSQGGTNHPTNLATLCWHHHHVVIHGNGHQIDPHSPPQRRRFLPPRRGPPG